MYSHGSSEEILGRALKDFANRDDVVIATKLRHPMRPGPNGAGLSRKAIMTEVDHSLRRLGTDYIDLYQIHRNDHATPLEETLEALHDLVKAGKVRYLGASSMHAWEFAKALHLQRQHGWARFVSMQDHYNLLAREEEREMIPLCLDEGVGTIVWSPLARGRLARAVGGREVDARVRDRRRFADMLYTPADRRQRPRHHRRGRRRRRGPRRQPGADRAGLAAQQARRHRAARRGQHNRPRSTTLSPRSTSSSPTRRFAALEALHAPLRLPGHLRRSRTAEDQGPDTGVRQRLGTSPFARRTAWHSPAGKALVLSDTGTAILLA